MQLITQWNCYHLMRYLYKLYLDRSFSINKILLLPDFSIFTPLICRIRLGLYWKPTDRIYLKIELEIKNLIASYIMSKILKFSNWILCGKQTHLHKHNLERFNSILMHWNKPPFQTQVHLSSQTNRQECSVRWLFPVRGTDFPDQSVLARIFGTVRRSLLIGILCNIFDEILVYV